MAKVKINTRILDKASGVTYEPSNSFVEVSETFARRIKDLQKDDRHKDNFEFYKAGAEKQEKVEKPKNNKK